MEGLDEVERAKAEGWRYLKLKPDEVESLTPRELTILMRAEQESRLDGYERMASHSMMIRQAYHAKKLKYSDLFKRPTDVSKAQKKAEDLLEQNRRASEWLSQFNFATERR